MIEEIQVDGGAAIRNWASILDESAMEQALVTSTLDILRAPVALMPDAHWGMGATIGSVLVTDDAVIPAAVGVDIGCGMAARQLSITEGALTPDVLKRWQAEMRNFVPAGLGHWFEGSTDATGQWIDQHTPPARLDSKEVTRAMQQLGSLGSGNHFVELAVDENGSVWILLHSGSRGVGKHLADIHQDIAAELTGALAPNRELAWITSDVPEFDAYLKDLGWAQAYALENRAQLLAGAHAALNRARDTETYTADEVNCHHNYAQQEFVVELGRRAYVTRKGAIRAGVDDRGLIPGAMGQASFLVRGLGNPLSYESCSHGAGRAMSRGRARREIPLDDFIAKMEGVTWQDRNAEELLDEAPQSYKPVEQVMADQADLVKIEHTFHAVANYKGFDVRRRKKGK